MKLSQAVGQNINVVLETRTPENTISHPNSTVRAYLFTPKRTSAGVLLVDNKTDVVTESVEVNPYRSATPGGRLRDVMYDIHAMLFFKRYSDNLDVVKAIHTNDPIALQQLAPDLYDRAILTGEAWSRIRNNPLDGIWLGPNIISTEVIRVLINGRDKWVTRKLSMPFFDPWTDTFPLIQNSYCIISRAKDKKEKRSLTLGEYTTDGKWKGGRMFVEDPRNKELIDLFLSVEES